MMVQTESLASNINSTDKTTMQMITSDRLTDPADRLQDGLEIDKEVYVLYS
jgi:hypothetical protein